jgi:hypothetical protein
MIIVEPYGTLSGRQMSPKKVRIFGWRAARDNLATKENKMRRTLELTAYAPYVKGKMKTSTMPLLLHQTKSTRYEMRKHWQLPPEAIFYFTGQDWFQNLLANLSKRQNKSNLNATLALLAPSKLHYS